MSTQTTEALNSRETNISRRPSLEKLVVRVAALEKSFQGITFGPRDFLSALWIAAIFVSCSMDDIAEIQALARSTGEVELPAHIRDCAQNVLEEFCQSKFGMTCHDFLLVIGSVLDNWKFVFDRAPQLHTASHPAEGDDSR